MPSYSTTLLFFIFFIAPAAFFAQSDINQKDENNLKQGYWIFYGKDKPESGIADSLKAEEGNYINDRKEGIWTKYHTDGKTPKLKGNYINNKPNGSYEKFYENGMIKERGCFRSNEYCDTTRRYFDNGALGYEATLAFHSNEEGRVNYYYRSGVLECTYVMTDWKQTELQCFDEQGNKKECGLNVKCSFDNTPTTRIPSTGCGGPISHPYPTTTSDTLYTAPVVSTQPNTKGVKWNPTAYNKVYNMDNEIWQDGVFREGKLWDGKVYIYDRDGILLKVKIFKGGVYHSDGVL